MYWLTVEGRWGVHSFVRSVKLLGERRAAHGDLLFGLEYAAVSWRGHLSRVFSFPAPYVLWFMPLCG